MGHGQGTTFLHLMATFIKSVVQVFGRTFFGEVPGLFAESYFKDAGVADIVGIYLPFNLSFIWNTNDPERLILVGMS